MKALISILVFTFFTILISCNTDDTIPQENSINSTITTTQEEIIENNDTGNVRKYITIGQTPEAAALEHTLQWTSYTIASVLYNYPIAKNQFLDRVNYNPYVHNSNITINIKDLIGTNIPDTDPFKMAFREELINLISLKHLAICPFGSSESPEPPLNTDVSATGSPIIPDDFIQSRTSMSDSTNIEEEVDAFIAYIIFDKCIEIYLPTGIISTFGEITSSAHPMSISATNNGYRTSLIQNCSAPGNDQTIENVDVDKDYTNTANGPIIIARPIRTGTCPYTAYDFNFRYFLN